MKKPNKFEIAVKCPQCQSEILVKSGSFSEYTAVNKICKNCKNKLSVELMIEVSKFDDSITSNEKVRTLKMKTEVARFLRHLTFENRQSVYHEIADSIQQDEIQTQYLKTTKVAGRA